MNYPKSVKVLAKTYKIRHLPSGHADLYHPDGYACYGLHYPAECQILLDIEVDHQQIVETLWHELTHAVDSALGLDLTEQQVHALAAGQMALFKDNKRLAELLLGSK